MCFIERFKKVKILQKKYLLLALISVLVIVICTGCGKEQGMDGTWVKTQIIESDGTVLTGEDAGPTEVYRIEGDRAWYSTSLEINDKEVGMELAIVKNEDDSYDFKIIVKGEVSERLALLTGVKFDGDKMTAEMYGGDTFVFKRK